MAFSKCANLIGYCMSAVDNVIGLGSVQGIGKTTYFLFIRNWSGIYFLLTFEHQSAKVLP